MHCSTSSSTRASASDLPSEEPLSPTNPRATSLGGTFHRPQRRLRLLLVADLGPRNAQAHKSTRYNILCTNAAPPRTPLHPHRGGGVGKPKSTVIFSSLQVTSTMISRSTQNNWTRSRDQGSKAPPPEVRAPTAALPRADLRAASPSLPPAMVNQSAALRFMQAPDHDARAVRQIVAREHPTQRRLWPPPRRRPPPVLGTTFLTSATSSPPSAPPG